GCDRADDAEGLATHDARQALHVFGRRAALEQTRSSGEEAEAVDDGRDLLRLRRGQRLAHVLGLDTRQLVAVLLDDRRDLEQHLAALFRRAVEPDLVESLAGGPDRTVDVLLSAFRHGGDDLAVGGVDDFLGVVAGAVDELAADENLVVAYLSLHSLTPWSWPIRAARR